MSKKYLLSEINITKTRIIFVLSVLERNRKKLIFVLLNIKNPKIIILIAFIPFSVTNEPDKNTFFKPLFPNKS